jgi:hypothetical protein
MTAEKVNLCELNTETLKNHEGRIQKLERQGDVFIEKLNTTNKILVVIATMIGGAIVSYFFSLLP